MKGHGFVIAFGDYQTYQTVLFSTNKEMNDV